MLKILLHLLTISIRQNGKGQIKGELLYITYLSALSRFNIQVDNEKSDVDASSAAWRNEVICWLMTFFLLISPRTTFLLNIQIWVHLKGEHDDIHLLKTKYKYIL